MGRACQISLLLLASVCLLGCVSGSDNIQEIKDKDATKFDKKIATDEVKKDIESFLKAYDNIKDDLEEISEKFEKTRVKDVGIRKIADWAIAMARVYELDGIPHDDKVRDAMKELAEMLLLSYSEEHSYVEDKKMRGWPMYVGPDDKEPIHESFNFGHIGMGVALGARAIALKGDDERAAEMITPVLKALYDGFLTNDKDTTKLDDDNRVVYVPKFASKDRIQRHLRVTEQEYCLDNPQAYNHGLMAARAAMAVWRVLNVIDWSKAEWTMDEWSVSQAMRELDSLVIANAEYLKDGLEEQPGTGSSSQDNYPGPRGTEWYQWKYRLYDKCPKVRGTFLDRPEDLAHATYETTFVAEVRQWAYEHKGHPDIVFDMNDAHRMMVTFLNRVVADYDAEGGHRFACDVDGTTDRMDRGNHAWKQCAGSRRLDVRAGFAPSWLPLAASVRYDIGKDDLVHCDALRMVKTVLPLVVPGKEFDKDNFRGLSVKFSSEAIQAKYYWHYYDNAMDKVCKGNGEQYRDLVLPDLELSIVNDQSLSSSSSTHDEDDFDDALLDDDDLQ